MRTLTTHRRATEVGRSNLAELAAQNGIARPPTHRPPADTLASIAGELDEIEYETGQTNKFAAQHTPAHPHRTHTHAPS